MGAYETWQERTWTVALTPELCALIVAIQKRRGISRSQVMRELLKAGVRHRARCLGKPIK